MVPTCEFRDMKLSLTARQEGIAWIAIAVGFSANVQRALRASAERYLQSWVVPRIVTTVVDGVVPVHVSPIMLPF